MKLYSLQRKGWNLLVDLLVESFGGCRHPSITWPYRREGVDYCRCKHCLQELVSKIQFGGSVLVK